MLLAIDIGNTNITLGVYDGEQLAAHWRVATVRDRMPDEYAVLLLQLLAHRGVAPVDITGVSVASVVPPLAHTFRDIAQEYLHHDALVVDANCRTGVRILVDNPAEVGADRVVNCAAAQHRYGGPACIVDFGTATTFDALSAQGDYLGGAIAPGVGIAAEALFARASRLYRVEIAPPPSVIGTNTAHSMQSGIFFGYVGLVEGLAERFRRELGDDMKVIATGGLAESVAAHSHVVQFIDPWLTLDGLRVIYDLNR